MSSSSHSKDQDQVEEALYTGHISASCGSAPRHRHEPVYTTVQNGSFASPTCFDDFPDQPEVEVGRLDDASEQKQMEVDSDEDLTLAQSGKENLRGLVPESQMDTFVNDAWEDLSGCFGKVCHKMGPSDVHKEDVSCNSPAQNTSVMADSAYEDGESEADKSCRAQDQSISSASTDNEFTYYQQSGLDSPPEQPGRGDNTLERKRKTEDDLAWAMQTIGVTSKGPEDLTVHHSVQEMPLVPPYKHDYLSFSPVALTGMIGDSGAKTVDVSPVVPAKAQSNGGEVQLEDKTEINIMEATMDNNEWLTGHESHSDFPWLSQSEGGESSSVAEESQQEVEWDTEKSEELSAAYISSDEDELAVKRVATVPPMLQTVHVTFSVHYITDAPNHLLAVTGNHQELGGWESFIPLQRSKNGFWANTVALPVESQLEWKFVLVVDGKISRWEECSNRQLVLTGREEDLYLLRWWGCL